MGGSHDRLPLPPALSVGLSVPGGLIRFSFWRLLQNHTRTTSFSMQRRSANVAISSLVGFGLTRKAFSNAPRTDVSMDVRFFLLRPMVSGVVSGLLIVLVPNILLIYEELLRHIFRNICWDKRCSAQQLFAMRTFAPTGKKGLGIWWTYPPGFEMVLSASSSHFCSNGFSLHIFLKLKFSASNLDMVVCEKSLP